MAQPTAPKSPAKDQLWNVSLLPTVTVAPISAAEKAAQRHGCRLYLVDVDVEVRDRAQRAFAGRVHQDAVLGGAPRKIGSVRARAAHDDDVGLDGSYFDPRDAA